MAREWDSLTTLLSRLHLTSRCNASALRCLFRGSETCPTWTCSGIRSTTMALRVVGLKHASIVAQAGLLCILWCLKLLQISVKFIELLTLRINLIPTLFFCLLESLLQLLQIVHLEEVLLFKLVAVIFPLVLINWDPIVIIRVRVIQWDVWSVRFIFFFYGQVSSLCFLILLEILSIPTLSEYHACLVVLHWLSIVEERAWLIITCVVANQASLLLHASGRVHWLFLLGQESSVVYSIREILLSRVVPLSVLIITALFLVTIVLLTMAHFRALSELLVDWMLDLCGNRDAIEE